MMWQAGEDSQDRSAGPGGDDQLRDILATLELSTIMVRTLPGKILYCPKGARVCSVGPRPKQSGGQLTIC
jgi:hypothetical protein